MEKVTHVYDRSGERCTDGRVDGRTYGYMKDTDRQIID